MCFGRLTGKTIENVINMGSYNYLGFAENNEDFLKTVADKTLQYGVGVCSSRQEVGESAFRVLFQAIPRRNRFLINRIFTILLSGGTRLLAFL